MLVKPENSNESVSEKEECMRPESVDLKAEEEVLELTESCDSKTKQSLYEVFLISYLELITLNISGTRARKEIPTVCPYCGYASAESYAMPAHIKKCQDEHSLSNVKSTPASKKSNVCLLCVCFFLH